MSHYAVLAVVDGQNQPALAIVPKSILLALQQYATRSSNLGLAGHT